MGLFSFMALAATIIAPLRGEKQITGFKVQVTSYKSQTTNYEPQTTNQKQGTRN